MQVASYALIEDTVQPWPFVTEFDKSHTRARYIYTTVVLGQVYSYWQSYSGCFNLLLLISEAYQATMQVLMLLVVFMRKHFISPGQADS